MIRAVEPTTRLCLTGEFQLLADKRSIAVPHCAQRLLAFLAIIHRPISRSQIAGQLWMNVSERRALGNLRSALWRLRRIPQNMVQHMDERLALDASIETDVAELTEISRRMLEAPGSATLSSLSELVSAGEILPGWEEEWLIVERERFHELRLRALERACEILMAAGNYDGAIKAGLAAAEAEPFRESTQRLLVRIHLSEGNRAAAVRSYLAYRELIQAELGIEPSELMMDLVANVIPPTARANHP